MKVICNTYAKKFGEKKVAEKVIQGNLPFQKCLKMNRI